MLSEISPKGRFTPLTPIDMLPDDVLLKIFDHHRLDAGSYVSTPWKWHRLVHVCRRWRTVVFSSPHSLKLQLVFMSHDPARNLKNLDCWPDLPISIQYPILTRHPGLSQIDEENIIAALKHPGRICGINLDLTHQLFEKLAPFMRDPFPMLETLILMSPDQFVIPSTFLGGSAPQLRHICLIRTPFPTLPQFLLTAPALVSLRLFTRPTTGYLSPEALVSGLATKPELEVLHIDGGLSGPGQQNPRSTYPQAHVAFPALTEFRFGGDNEYLEDLISRIDTPKVEQFFVTLSDDRTFDFPRLAEFIGRTEHLKLSPHRTSIRLWEHGFSITHDFTLPFPGRIFELQINRDKSMGHIKPLTHVCRQLSLLLCKVERLDIEALKMISDWHGNPDTVQRLEWLGLFSLFGAVRTLRLIGDLIPFAASSLEQSSNMGYGTVMPFLQDLHMRCLNSSSPQMDSFLAFRRRSGCVISIHYTRAGDEAHNH